MDLWFDFWLEGAGIYYENDELDIEDNKDENDFDCHIEYQVLTNWIPYNVTIWGKWKHMPTDIIDNVWNNFSLMSLFPDYFIEI